MAKPRVFVSSTYYDFKYARERLERFIKAYNMEPVLFESDDVYFEPNQDIDKSCYKEVQNCHMMILIVGGRYGSIASNANSADAQEEKDKYNSGYASITRKEYETAQKNKIYTLVFIDRNVYAEYKTFSKNRDCIPENFEFAHVDDCRIFDFISELELNYIRTFDKIEDIEHCIANQISGMLYLHLENLKKDANSGELKNSVEQIQTVSKSMQEMLNLIGDKILGAEQKDEYNKLIKQQRKDLINFFFSIFIQNYTINKDPDCNSDIQFAAEKICEIILGTIFNAQNIQDIEGEDNPIKRSMRYRKLEVECSRKILASNAGFTFGIKHREYRRVIKQVLDILDKDNSLRNYFDDVLKKTIEKSIYLNSFTYSFKSKDESNTEE